MWHPQLLPGSDAGEAAADTTGNGARALASLALADCDGAPSQTAAHEDSRPATAGGMPRIRSRPLRMRAQSGTSAGTRTPKPRQCVAQMPRTANDMLQHIHPRKPALVKRALSPGLSGVDGHPRLTPFQRYGAPCSPHVAQARAALIRGAVLPALEPAVPSVVDSPHGRLIRESALSTNLLDGEQWRDAEDGEQDHAPRTACSRCLHGDEACGRHSGAHSRMSRVSRGPTAPCAPASAALVRGSGSDYSTGAPCSPYCAPPALIEASTTSPPHQHSAPARHGGRRSASRRMVGISVRVRRVRSPSRSAIAHHIKQVYSLEDRIPAQLFQPVLSPRRR